MRRRTRVPGALVGVAAPAAAALSGRAGDPFSTEPVAIGPQGCTIPPTYIDFIRYDDGGKVLWMFLKVLRPGLAPLTGENAYRRGGTD